MNSNGIWEVVNDKAIFFVYKDCEPTHAKSLFVVWLGYSYHSIKMHTKSCTLIRSLH